MKLESLTKYHDEDYIDVNRLIDTFDLIESTPESQIEMQNWLLNRTGTLEERASFEERYPDWDFKWQRICGSDNERHLISPVMAENLVKAKDGNHPCGTVGCYAGNIYLWMIGAAYGDNPASKSDKLELNEILELENRIPTVNETATNWLKINRRVSNMIFQNCNTYGKHTLREVTKKDLLATFRFFRLVLEASGNKITNAQFYTMGSVYTKGLFRHHPLLSSVMPRSPGLLHSLYEDSAPLSVYFKEPEEWLQFQSGEY